MSRLPVGHLTQMQIRAIERALYFLDLAHEYLSNDRTAVCLKNIPGTTPLHYTRAVDNSTMYEVDKEIGSNLTGLDWGIAHLRWMITPIKEGK